jgi:DAACS family dicarboxylate/amino acid:cation (Na+ or H+) symporter
MAETDTRLGNRILIGLACGALAALLVHALSAVVPGLLPGATWLSVNVLDPFGQVFLRLLFFVVLPLVFCSLAHGVLQLGDMRSLGRLASRTFLMFVLNMAIGTLLGLLMMNVLQPGHALSETLRLQLVSDYGGAARSAIQHQAENPGFTLITLVDMFLPRNLFGAFIGNDRKVLGDVLPLILFAILVGISGTRLAQKRHEQLREALETGTEVMTGIVHLALKLAPYAVPALIFSVVVRVGPQVLVALGLFVLGCVSVMLLHLFGTMSLWLKLWARVPPLEFFRRIRTVLITAFTTSSSNATLPAALAVAREQLGIRPQTAGFVLPLGTTMNMSGTALYEGCVVLFVAQVFGVELSLLSQLTLLVLAVLSAVAVAGIPGGSLPLIAGLLISFGIPPEGIGIILGVDRLLDMTRTMVNVGCDLVTCQVVDRDGHEDPG